MPEPQQIGRYNILEELGRGAMGRVLRAEDPTIRRQVAIKIISLSAGASAEEQATFERSFLREIRSAGGLHHPGIVSIFDAGRQDDLAYIVMELVDGVTFDGMLQSTPRPDILTLLRVCREVAVALDYAHSNGIVHRDIKPANILLSQNGTARVADFGIAKLPRHCTTASFSKTVLGAGTPEFMAPEQIQGLTLDGRTDQWALAVMAYRVMTKAKPFQAEQMAAVLGQILSLDPAPPCKLNPELPAAVDAVIARGLCKDPAGRYETCVEFVDALETAYSGRPHSKVAPPPAEAEEPAAGSLLSFKSRTTMLAALAAVLVVIAAAIFLLTHRKPMAAAAVPHDAAAQPATAGQPGVPLRSASPFSPTAPADSKASVPHPAAEPAARKMYQVRLVTIPAEADLIIDGKPDSACKSPCPVELTQGTHSLVAKKDGYQTIVREIQVTPDQAEIAIPLREVTGSLLLETQPPGATILVNGQARTEVTPATLTLPPGKYKVRLVKEGFDAYDFDASVLPESTREVSVTLAKSGG